MTANLISTTATRPAPRSPLDAEELGSNLWRVLDSFLARQSEVLRSVSADLAVLGEALSALLAKGKRLRPAFLYWGWRGAGEPADNSVVRAAAALELFHAAALLHDDVMDGSDTRRGMATAHRRFEAGHRASRLLGDPAAFGRAAAVLLGDLCMAWSDELFTGCGLDPSRLARGRPVFDLMRTQVMGGQYLDLLEQARGEFGVERARSVIRWKSAKYTVEHPLLLGGSLAGAPPRLLDAYSAFEVLLGEAFQLRDDVLGVFGDPRRTGKPAGDDVREGKRTVLVALAHERATPAQRAVLAGALGNPQLTERELHRVREVLAGTGALGAVERSIQRLTERARATLAAAAVPAPAGDMLQELARTATVRST